MTRRRLCRRAAPVILTALAGAGLGGGPSADAGAAVAFSSAARRPGQVRHRRTASPGPRVAVLVVGRVRPFFGPAAVRASGATVPVGGRRCAVASGTALAALVAAAKTGGPSFALRDYASCSRSARDAGGLFVYRVGPDANRAQAGWVYKVDRRTGTAGAGDPLGAFGDRHRLRDGQRVLWFWCRRAGGCQRALELSGVPARVAPGARLTVRVLAYDDRGSGTPAAGARVWLAGAPGTPVALGGATGRNGRVVLTAPGTPGRYSLSATAAGLVPAFAAGLSVR